MLNRIITLLTIIVLLLFCASASYAQERGGEYQPKPWTLGLLGRQLWSFSVDSDRKSVSQLLLQPFITYILDGGWYLISDIMITANWKAEIYSAAGKTHLGLQMHIIGLQMQFIVKLICDRFNSTDRERCFTALK